MQSVDLWLLSPATLEADLPAWVALLDEEERARHERLRHRADQLAFVAAHGLLRKALSMRFPSVAPTGWHFSVTQTGKPELDGVEICFNLSHCRELVAVAIAKGSEIGVDVEPVDARHSSWAVAQRVYGPSELADLASQPDEAQRVQRFFERWTIKESWVKATGVGLSDDLPAFEVRLSAGRAFVERGDERPWQLHWWTPGPNLKLALCVGTAVPLVVEPKWWNL